MKSLFNRSKAPGRAALVKGWITERFGLSVADLVSVAELACHEPGCPPIETVVTVHGTDGARCVWHLHKSLADIGADDIEALAAKQ